MLMWDCIIAQPEVRGTTACGVLRVLLGDFAPIAWCSAYVRHGMRKHCFLLSLMYLG
jgi:hypothetical protein